MTVFDKKLNIWIVDDLANRRDSHQQIIEKEIPEASIIKCAHPLHLKAVLDSGTIDLKDTYNIFFSDFNMKWSNVEWTGDLNETEKLKPNSHFDNFPGTQKVLEEELNSIDSFLLVMLSTMVVEDSYSTSTSNTYLQTEDEAWTYDELKLNSIGINSIHKLSKPFNNNKLKQVIRHYNHLIKHLTKPPKH